MQDNTQQQTRSAMTTMKIMNSNHRPEHQTLKPEQVPHGVMELV